MKYQGEHVYIRPLELSDAEAMTELRIRNREFMKPYEPIRPDSHFTVDGQRALIEKALLDAENDIAYTFGIFEIGTDRLVGRLTFTGVSRGQLQSAFVGYYMDQQLNGRGYTTEAVKLSLRFAFEEIDLHRVEAGVMPRNIRSIRVMEKAGFRFEGTAKRYLNINDVWEDHNKYAITIEEWQA